MRESYTTHRKKIIVLSAGILFLVGVAFLPIPRLLFVDAYSAPPCGGGACPGAISVDTTNNNVSVGTSTVLSTTKFLIVASNTSVTDYGLQVVGPGGSSYLAVRNDGNTGIGINDPDIYRLYVNGSIYSSGNLVGNISAGSINAEQITQGIFGASSTNGLNSQYAFPSSVGIGTTTFASLPQALSVYGNGYISGSLGVGTSSPSVPLEVVTTNPDAMRLRSSAGGGTMDFYPTVFGPAVIYASTPLQINSSMWVTATSGVGILTSAPSYNLDVNGTFRANGTSTFFGQLGIGTSTPAYPLDVSGTVRATNDICTPNVCLTATGGVNLSGTANYLAKWSSGSALTASSYIKEEPSSPQITIAVSSTAQSGVNIYNGYILAMATSSANGGGTPASSTGIGIRMMWIPGKSGAFRAGEIDSSGCQCNWNDTNIGTRSFALGLDTLANATNSVAMGNTTTASGQNAFAVGDSTVASGNNSFAFGDSNIAAGQNSFAGGGGSGSHKSIASGANSFAMGDGVISSGTNAFAFGQDTRGIGKNSAALGQGSIAGGDASFAVGNSATATSTASIAMGNSVTSNGSSSVAIGNFAVASGPYAIAIGGSSVGNYPTAGGTASLAIGGGITVNGAYSIGIGLNAGGVSVNSSSVMAVMGGNVGIGTTNPLSALHVAGPITVDTTSTSGTSYTIASSSPWGTYYANANGASNLVITLPTPTGAFQGRFYNITRVSSGANNVTVTAGGGGVLGTTSLTAQYQTLRIVGFVDSGGTARWISTKLSP